MRELKSLSKQLSTVFTCGFRKERPDVQVLDQNEDEEFESLVKELSPDTSLKRYIDLGMDDATS